MNEASPTFVTMVSCHLGATPMNWYRQYSVEWQRTGTVKTWKTFTEALRKRFLPPDHEFGLCEKLHQLKHKDSVHSYVADFQNILIQCRVRFPQWNYDSTFSLVSSLMWLLTFVRNSHQRWTSASPSRFATTTFHHVPLPAQQRAG